jgi:UrcA family protein
MLVTFPACRKHALILLGLACAIATGAALADPIEVVVVEAARTVKTAAPSSVATAHDVSLQGWVRCADLDLATDAGAAELAKRIEQTAKSLCKELDEAYPLIKDDSCVKNAANKAMADARKAIDAQHVAVKSK